MFIGYVGRPGGGKSYDAVRKIIDNLRAGRVVATNIDGMGEKKCQEAIKQLSGLDDYEFATRFIFLKKEDVSTFWIPRSVPGSDIDIKQPLVPCGALVVLDEVHKWINSREWASDQNKRFAEWGAEHRHDGYDVILITQDINKVDKQIRSLIEFTYFYRKINFFGNLIKKRYLKYSYDGDDHEGKSSVAPSTHSYDKRYFRAYRSFKRPEIVEKDFQTHINVLKHPVFFALPLVIGYAIYSLCTSGLVRGDLFGTQARLARAETIKSGSPVKVASVPPGAVPDTGSVKVERPGLEISSDMKVETPPVQPNEITVKNSTMVRGWILKEDCYRVLLEDGSIRETKKRPELNREMVMSKEGV